MLGPDTQKQSLGRRSKFGRNHLEKLGPSSGYEYHHKETIRQTDGQYTPLLSQLQQNLLNMQMFSPALSLLCMSPALSSSLPSPTIKPLSWLSHLPNSPGKNCGEDTHCRHSPSVSCGSGCLHKCLTASFILRDVNSKNVSSCHCRCKCQKLAFFHHKTE